jgi:hypothetical protein
MAATTAEVADKVADHLLNTYVYVSTIKCGYACVQKCLHVGNRIDPVYRTMISSQLPAPFDNPGDCMIII